MFFDVIHQIPRSHGLNIWRFKSNLSKITSCLYNGNSYIVNAASFYYDSLRIFSSHYESVEKIVLEKKVTIIASRNAFVKSPAIDCNEAERKLSK